MIPKLVKHIIERYIPQKQALCLADVGSMDGLDREWDQIKKHIRAMAFEPDEREYQKLKSDDNILYCNTVLWSKKEDLKFHILRRPGTSSVYKPNPHFFSKFLYPERFEVIKEIDIPKSKVTTLDTLSDEMKIHFDFMKLDTQGAELDILKGGENCLNEILGLKVEVEFCEMYINQPLFEDVNMFLKSKDYELFSLRRAYFKRRNYLHFRGQGQLIYGDALYFKKINAFFETKLSESMDVRTIKFMAICLLYGCVDYAVSILEESVRRGVLSEDFSAEFMKLISKYNPPPIQFPGSVQLRAVLDRMSFFLNRSCFGGDHFLGNRSYWR